MFEVHCCRDRNQEVIPGLFTLQRDRQKYYVQLDGAGRLNIAPYGGSQKVTPEDIGTVGWKVRALIEVARRLVGEK